MTSLRKVTQAVIDFLFHSSAYGMTRELIRQRAELDSVLMLLVLGNRVGLPLFPSYYSHRLWPYLLPRVPSWKRSMLRPKGLGYW